MPSSFLIYVLLFINEWNMLLCFFFVIIFKDFLHLTAQAGGAAEGKEETDSPLSREPNVELDPGTLG